MVRAQASGGENAHRWAVGAISEGVGENMEPLLLTLATWRRGTVRCDLLSYKATALISGCYFCYTCVDAKHFYHFFTRAQGMCLLTQTLNP